MEPLVWRLQAHQARIQELAQYVQPPSPDYQAVARRTIERRAKCKYGFRTRVRKSTIVTSRLAYVAAPTIRVI